VLVVPLWKTIWRLLRKLKIELPFDPAIPVLRKYPKECKITIKAPAHLCLFLHALFTKAKPWKQPRCPTADKWIKKMWYLYTMEFYSATKKNEILSFAGKWIELENISLSKVSQAQKANSCIYSYVEYRPNTNAAILQKTGHTKGRSHTRGGVQKKEVKEVNTVDVKNE
jgi:hypothetical protein